MEVQIVHTAGKYPDLVQSLKDSFEAISKKGKVFIAEDIQCYGYLNNVLDVFVLGEFFREEHNNYGIELNKQVAFVNSFCFFLKVVDLGTRSTEKITDKVNLVYADGSVMSLTSFAGQLGQNAEKYLAGVTGFGVSCAPVLLVKNNKTGHYFSLKDGILSDRVNLQSIFKIIAYQRLEKFGSPHLYAFFEKGFHVNLDIITAAIQVYNSQLAAESFLTRPKVDQITKQQLKEQLYNNQLGRTTLIFRGPAGSGKTLKMISICQDLYSRQQKRLLFLTFNQSLVKDLTRLAFLAGMREQVENPSLAIQSLHNFVYNAARDLHIFSVLSLTRRQQLEEELKSACGAFLSAVDAGLAGSRLNLKTLRDFFTAKRFTAEEQHKFLSICQYLEKKAMAEELHIIKVKELLRGYQVDRTTFLVKAYENNFFLGEYDNILTIIAAILKSDMGFYLQAKSHPAFRQLPIAGLRDFSLLVSQFLKEKASLDFIFVDEAQDWSGVEKQILFKIFDAKKFVITDGQQQQLIRSRNYLDWTHHNGKKIDHYIAAGSVFKKSLRQKKNLCLFQNEFGRITNNAWQLEPGMDDTGKIYVTQSPLTREKYYALKNNASANKNDEHDGILFFIPSAMTQKEKKEVAVVDKKGQISTKEETADRRFALEQEWVADWQMPLWNGTTKNDHVYSKKRLPQPKSSEHRLYLYESCRGLEAWTVVCLAMDEFYEQKKFNFAKEGADAITGADAFAANWCRWCSAGPLIPFTCRSMI